MPVIILAMHGAPPNDFPTNETIELFNLHARLEHSRGQDSLAMRERYDQLDAKMRAWERTPKNDPFYSGSLEIANRLREATQQEVILGFNEFCAPNLDEAFEQAMEFKPAKIIVVTPMMTRGGEHSEVDIPAMIKRAEARFPGVDTDYIWPLNPSQEAGFLAAQIAHFDNDRSPTTKN